MNLKNCIVTLFFYSILIFSFGCNKENTPTPKSKILKISSSDDPTTLDARLGTDLITATVLLMLNEGLMRTDIQGNIVPAVADSVHISDDGRIYTFYLKEAYWSDGSPVTAHDFEETWKSVLNPNFPSPNAYQLYVIKGAKACKEGAISAKEVGIKALTPKTLIVELDQPASYFLKLAAAYFYFPVHKNLRQKPMGVPNATDSSFVSNGPFKLKHWKHKNELAVEKNPLYWDAEKVLLEQILVLTLDENTAYQMYEAHEIDWMGSPMNTLPQDAVLPLKQQGKLQIIPGAGTHWFRFNIEKAPFHNLNMRRAFALALDRKSIVDHVTQGNQIPATGIVPPPLGLKNDMHFVDHSTDEAVQLFKIALQEMQIDKNQLPDIILYYSANDREHKIAQAVQQQWSQAFGIPVQLMSLESKTFRSKVKNHDYQLATGSWYADFSDPINFLEVFKSKKNSTNSTQWENASFANLLDRSDKELEPSKRMDILQKAEGLLIEEMPIAPLFFAAFNYVKNEKVKNVYFSELGFLDFKYASIED